MPRETAFIVLPFLTEERAKEELAKINCVGKVIVSPKITKAYNRTEKVKKVRP